MIAYKCGNKSNTRHRWCSHAGALTILLGDANQLSGLRQLHEEDPSVSDVVRTAFRHLVHLQGLVASNREQATLQS
jgi:hypothetical protein